MTRQERAIAALAALRADGWTLPTSTVPIDLLLDTKADALDIIAERDILRAKATDLIAMTEAAKADSDRYMLDMQSANRRCDNALAERDSLRAKVERLEIERGRAVPLAEFEARIRAEERAKIASWLQSRHEARSVRRCDPFYGEGRQDELADIIAAITNNEHDAP